MISEKTLRVFFNTPGLLTVDELLEVKSYLKKLNEDLKLYILASNWEPLGYTIDSNIDTVNWYLRFKEDNQQ